MAYTRRRQTRSTGRRSASRRSTSSRSYTRSRSPARRRSAGARRGSSRTRDVRIVVQTVSNDPGGFISPQVAAARSARSQF